MRAKVLSLVFLPPISLYVGYLSRLMYRITGLHTVMVIPCTYTSVLYGLPWQEFIGPTVSFSDKRQFRERFCSHLVREGIVINFILYVLDTCMVRLTFCTCEYTCTWIHEKHIWWGHDGYMYSTCVLTCVYGLALALHFPESGLCFHHPLSLS